MIWWLPVEVSLIDSLGPFFFFLVGTRALIVYCAAVDNLLLFSRVFSVLVSKTFEHITKEELFGQMMVNLTPVILLGKKEKHIFLSCGLYN